MTSLLSKLIQSSKYATLECLGYTVKKNVSAIKINSKRVDDVFGIHKITFTNEEKSIYFKHEALSRDIFATGALECAANIHKLKPNLYNFEDIIN